MSKTGKRWLLGIGLALVSGAIALFVLASVFSKRFEPFIRDQAVAYMRERFDSDVELADLRIHMPKTSTLRLLMTRGRGASAHVVGAGISMRSRSARDLPPLFSIKKFSFDVDLETLLVGTKTVKLVTLEGMEITIPPKGERPKLGAGATDKPGDPGQPNVIIKEVQISGATLVILPRNKQKTPLRFDIHDLRLTSKGPGLAMQYNATLTNPKPPGHIQSKGAFGPWVKGEPGDTPISGDYIFDEADLGVFAGIAGILKSTGSFEGSLSSITARGEASVPNFRLKMAGNPVPLTTSFEVLVDGTNGNTILQPVKARLGTTNFTTSGAVLKRDGDVRRTITLDVSMPKGNLRDLLRLAMKGSPFMEGQVALKTKIGIPPLTSKVREKLMLDGRFVVSQGKFLRSSIQEQIDSLSRRGQGQPKSEEIDEVVSRMEGIFKLENEIITFRKLSFGVPGADVALAGTYNLDADALDFRGTLKLAAKVSQTMTGWKRWALKPVDPLFAKEGAGTFLRIQVEGTSRQPKFGRDRKDKSTPKISAATLK